LFGWGGKEALRGDAATNVMVAGATLVLVFAIPGLAKRHFSKMASLISGTFCAIVLMTAACQTLGLEIERVRLDVSLQSWSDLTNLVAANIPRDWSLAIVLAALPFAMQLALLGYLDSLLTSLVIDRMTNSSTRPNQELTAQGIGQAVVALVGGIPGAQATIRSVLLVKEGATLRLAGILVGIFALVEMLVFQKWMELIPQAVFTGVLIKVGYDVFDSFPFRQYARQWRLRMAGEPEPIVGTVHVTVPELVFVVGTAATTVALDLNLAVGAFTLLFYVYNKLLFRQRPMLDLKALRRAPMHETTSNSSQAAEVPPTADGRTATPAA
jgi:SulP family sulfate permease